MLYTNKFCVTWVRLLKNLLESLFKKIYIINYVY